MQLQVCITSSGQLKQESAQTRYFISEGLQLYVLHTETAWQIEVMFIVYTFIREGEDAGS
jgi:hypothetical protein